MAYGNQYLFKLLKQCGDCIFMAADKGVKNILTFWEKPASFFVVTIFQKQTGAELKLVDAASFR